MLGMLKRIVGSKNDRELKRIVPLVEQTNRLEPELVSSRMRACARGPPISGSAWKTVNPWIHCSPRPSPPCARP